MNKASEFVSRVVDEIERRKHLAHLQDSMSFTAYHIDKYDKERKIVQSKLDRLNKKLKWWNKWFLSKLIKEYQQKLDRLNDNIAFSQRALDAMIRTYKQKKDE